MEWSQITDKELRKRILHIVNEVLPRFKNPEFIQKNEVSIIEQRKSLGKDYIPWSPLDLARGFSGLCVMFANMDHLCPNDGYDLIGHQYMLMMQNVLMNHPNLTLDLWSGIAGLATATDSLSRGGERYQNILKEFQTYLLTAYPGFLQYIANDENNGLSTRHYDVIQGLSGIGRYLLEYREQPAMRDALNQTLLHLVNLCKDKQLGDITIPGWHIPYDQFFGSNREDYPYGHFNCGMSHGIAGILALMSLALMKGVEVEGQRDTIVKLTTWLMDWKQADAFGPIWPSHISLEEFLAGRPKSYFTRAAWCYGDAGIARAVWLAGQALDNASYRKTALDTFLAIAKRPESSWNLESHTFCHGYAGLLEMVQRMYSESHEEALLELRNRLVEKLLSLWNQEEPYGFHEEGNQDVQYLSGLLDGAAGVYCVLIGLLQETDPEWDKVFLIS